MRGWVLLAGVLVGCGTARAHSRAVVTRAQVAARAEAELNCPHVIVDQLGDGGWRAVGCRRSQTYTCATRPESSHREVVCMPDEPSTTSSTSAAEALPSALAPADADVARRALASCAGALDHGAVVVTIGIGGEVQRVETPGLTTDLATCAVQSLRGATFAPSSSVRRGQVVAGSTSTATAPSAGEATARAFVEAHRDVILACTGTSAAAVVATWTATGAITLALPDAQAGTAQDGCVRSSAAGTLSPAPGSAGSVLHAVH
jgi:hypothetical protein